MQIDLNWLAVIVSGLASMVLGFLWYGPIFGKKWIALMGWTPEQIEAGKKQSMAKNYILTVVGSLLTAYVMSYAVILGSAYIEASGVSVGLISGFWAWLGFVVPLTLSSVLWEGKSWSLWVLNNGYNLLNLLIIGSIVAAWM